MNSRIIAFFATLAMILTAVLIMAARTGGPIRREAVAVTVFPLYDLVKEIAPDGVEVILLLPPGTSPHTYEPNPSTVRNLERSKVLFAAGQGLDNWATELARSVETPVVASYSGVKVKVYGEDDDEEDGSGHGGADPHFWLSMQNAISLTATVTVELQSRFPDKRDEITAHHNSLLGKLRETDRLIREELDPIENRSMVTLHGAWYYFAEEYGFDVVATFEPSAGQEPTPQALADLAAIIDRSGATTIYTEPQLSAGALEPFAADNGIGIAVLDPLGGTEGRESYIDMMLYNAKTIADNQ